MVTKLLIRSQVPDAQWDLFIAQSQQRIVYAYSWYLDTVCDDWHAFVWPSAEDFQIVMPVPIKRKVGFKVVQQPLFCQYLGIFSRNELLSDQVNLFLHALFREFSYISTYSFSPHNHTILSPILSRFPALNPVLNHTFWLNLNHSEKIRSEYSLSRRSNLRQSAKFGWEPIRNSLDMEPIINLFRSNHALGIQGGVDEKAYVLLSRLFEKLIEKQCAELCYAGLNNDIHAGCLFVREGNTTIYLFNAADDTGRKYHARTYLLDKYFARQAGSHLIFDFESPEIRSIASFYESFGAAKIPFISIRQNNLPFPLKLIHRLKHYFFTKTRQGLSAILCMI